MNVTGCDPIRSDPSWPDEPILMIDRGECSFATKVRNAEMAGAVAVVIADNQPLCEVGECSNVPCDCTRIVGDCECRMPYMADDGSGGDVNIPSFLLGKFDTDKFKECILGTGAAGSLCAQPTPVVVSMEWSLPRTDGVVYFDLWTTAEEVNAAAFRRDIAYLIEPLGASIQFEPHFFIYDGARWGCMREYNGGFACGNQCTNSGRYCSPDPDAGFDTGHSGADVVQENLRQMCIWKQANQTYEVDYGMRWWRYASLFDEHCVAADVDWAECSNEQQYAVGIDAGFTNDCVNAAGGTDERGPVNSVLEAEVRLRDDLVIVTMPTVIVNDVIERGATTTQNVLSMLCAGFLRGSEPLLCKYCQAVAPEGLDSCLKRAEDIDSGSGDVSGDDDHAGQRSNDDAVHGPSDSEGVNMVLIVVVIVLVLVVGAGGFVGYRQLSAMRQEVDGIKYRALAGDADEAAKAGPVEGQPAERWGNIPTVDEADVELRTADAADT